MRWGMVINFAKCMRCHACVAACRIEHFLPLRVTWPRLIAYETDDGGEVDVSTYPVRCNQCKEAPCVDVCPTGASQQREDGIVAIDQTNASAAAIVSSPVRTRTAPSLSKNKNPGYFPGYPRPILRKRAKSSIPHQVGHHG